jgi:hypothetical protein
LELGIVKYNTSNNTMLGFININDNDKLENGDNITIEQLKDSIICNVYISEDTINNTFLF